MNTLPILTNLVITATGTGAQDITEPIASAAATPLEATVLWALILAVQIGVVTIIGGIGLCLYRILRGPSLADRVLAADALSLHVVGLVILIAVRFSTTTFFDVALVVAIIGFASTLAFAQYIGATAQRSAS